MAKFKTKTVEIEAIEFTGNNFKTVQNFCGVRYADAAQQYAIPNFDDVANWWPALNDSSVPAVVFTATGWQAVRAGDFIVKRDALFEVINSSQFVSQYEPV